MFENFPFFPDQASTVAPQVDALYFFLVAVSVFFATLITLMIIVFAIKYRRRSDTFIPHPVEGSIPLELIWTIIPFIIVMVIFFWGARVFFTIHRPPAGALEIFVVGKQWMWKFQHPTGQREINELHVPVGRPIRLTMASEDVIHSLFVPAFRVKTDVEPGKYKYVWFTATRPGRYHLFCTEYCGTKHAAMGGSVVVMEPAAFETWLSGGPSEGSPVDLGQKLFQDLGCHTCHQQDTSGRGPTLEGLFGKEVLLQNGQTVIADETYLRESILNPHQQLVAGFQPIMPTFQGQISEEGLLHLIAYIKSLGGASKQNATPPQNTTLTPAATTPTRQP